MNKKLIRAALVVLTLVAGASLVGCAGPETDDSAAKPAKTQK